MTDDERFVKEDILRLFGRHPMTFPVLVGILCVPVESDTIIERVLTAVHRSSIHPAYTNSDGPQVAASMLAGAYSIPRTLER